MLILAADTACLLTKQLKQIATDIDRRSLETGNSDTDKQNSDIANTETDKKFSANSKTEKYSNCRIKNYSVDYLVLSFVY